MVLTFNNYFFVSFDIYFVFSLFVMSLANDYILKVDLTIIYVRKRDEGITDILQAYQVSLILV